MAQWLLTSLRKLAVSSMRNSWTIFKNAPLCFRLFIQDRVFPLVLTSSSSRKTKQIIVAATRLLFILVFFYV